MGKSLRSKTKLKFRNQLRNKVFEPAEEARRQRLAAKLLGHVKEVMRENEKEKHRAKNGNKEEEDEEMEVQKEVTEGSEGKKEGGEEEPKKAKTGSWKKKVKKNRSFKGRRKR
ncbi:uncharacterized protein SAPINGB_P005697 [Magnusiomyces paraingens]|uniref:DUF2423 domain-containing protein n=1 Tax=Magnusiomyces paraingens TaxID=2606893 RepID=A0A5E8C645_9ASCO|nr:uncharacterized protein SAPINGB_P005697 [Saprochaete ingens]VVT57441.1 unnamed protein product [Saprochaete ingens]